MSELISSSMEEIEGSDALLTQILVRLPLTDVITFKRVSKRWLSLISAPYFRRCHATLQRTTVGLILDPHIDPPDRELTFFYFDKEIRRSSRQPSFCPKIPDNCSYILQSCNGLMILHRFNDMFIYNPTTGAKKPLPSPFPLFNSSDFRYTLAFDPSRFLGYKLICIFHGDSCYRPMIYSSQSGAWKHCVGSFSAHFDMDFTRGVYFKGSVYWIGNKSKTTLRFDLKEERGKDDLPPLPPDPQDLNIGGPSYLNSTKVISYYNEYGYVLAPACGYMNLVEFDFKFCMRVFRLNEDDYSSSRSWVLMHNVDLRHTGLKTVFNNLNLPNKWKYSILHLIKDGEDDGMALLLQIPGKVIALRLKDNTLYDMLYLKLKENKPPHDYHFPGVVGWFRAFEYVESLTCP